MGLGCAGIAIGGLMLALPTAAVAAAPPSAYGAAAQGKGIHQNYNAIASLDPALGASRATAQVDPFGSPPVQLSSYGYTNDPGTLAGAVLFAPGNPTTTSNFPSTAEAFFPVPDQEHVAKCIVNNDATDKSRTAACDQTRTNTQYAMADVAPKNPLGPSAEGFAGTVGTTFGNGIPLLADHVTSHSLIVPDKSGRLTVLQENRGTNVTLPGSPVRIASFEASSHLISTATEVTGDATCSIDVVIAGQHVPVSEVQRALGALKSPAGSPVLYSFSPPTKPVVARDALGATASCTGAVLEIANPTTGSFVTYTFGETDARAARLGQTLAAGGAAKAPSPTPSDNATSAPLASQPPTGPADTPAAAGAPAAEVVATTPTGATATLPPAPAEPAAGGSIAQPAQRSSDESQVPRLIVRKTSALPIGVVTAVGASAIGLGVWALIGAVAALAAASGTRLSGP